VIVVIASQYPERHVIPGSLGFHVDVDAVGKNATPFQFLKRGELSDVAGVDSGE
jgi:hypothetical protein